MKNREYWYFISYAHSRGFGCATIARKTAIERDLKKGENAIKEIEEALEKNGDVSNITILNFKRL